MPKQQLLRWPDNRPAFSQASFIESTDCSRVSSGVTADTALSRTKLLALNKNTGAHMIISTIRRTCVDTQLEVVYPLEHACDASPESR